MDEEPPENTSRILAPTLEQFSTTAMRNMGLCYLTMGYIDAISFFGVSGVRMK